MVSITLSVPEEVKKKMEKHSEINWSGFVRKAIIEKTEKLDWKEDMLKKLEEEQPLFDWAVDLIREGRKGRYEELKKKGVL